MVQCITRIALIKLKQLPDYLKNLTEKKEEGATESKNESEEEKKKNEKEEEDKEPPDPGEEEWSLEDTERLLTYMSRVFMLQFPLYLAAKQAGSRLDDLSQAEATSLAVFLDVSGDVADIPLVLLRNVARFCRSGGLLAMTQAFRQEPSHLPPLHSARARLHSLQLETLAQSESHRAALWVRAHCGPPIHVQVREKKKKRYFHHLLFHNFVAG